MKDIDELLRADAREAMPDHGFSHRVMTALPARTAATRPWLKPAIVLGSTALGATLAAVLAPGGLNLLQGFADLVEMRGLTPAAISGISMAGALLLSALVLTLEAD